MCCVLNIALATNSVVTCAWLSTQTAVVVELMIVMLALSHAVWFMPVISAAFAPMEVANRPLKTAKRRVKINL